MMATMQVLKSEPLRCMHLLSAIGSGLVKLCSITIIMMKAFGASAASVSLSKLSVTMHTTCALFNFLHDRRQNGTSSHAVCFADMMAVTPNDVW